MPFGGDLEIKDEICSGSCVRRRGIGSVLGLKRRGRIAVAVILRENSSLEDGNLSRENSSFGNDFSFGDSDGLDKEGLLGRSPFGRGRVSLRKVSKG